MLNRAFPATSVPAGREGPSPRKVRNHRFRTDERKVRSGARLLVCTGRRTPKVPRTRTIAGFHLHVPGACLGLSRVHATLFFVVREHLLWRSRESGDPKCKGKIAFTNPAKSESAYSTVTMLVNLFGGGAADWTKVRQLLANRRVVNRSSLVFQGVGNGEYPLGISLECAGYVWAVCGGPVKTV